MMFRMITHNMRSEVGQPYNLVSKPGHFGTQKEARAAEMLNLKKSQNNSNGPSKSGH